MIKQKQKKGNVIIIVICLVVALMIALAYLLKNTTSRIHTTKKLGSTLYARELASSLASLSVKYLKQQISKNDSDIVDILSLPINDFKDSGEKDLLKKLKSIVNLEDYKKILDLIASKSNLKDLKIEKLFWKVTSTDFRPIGLGVDKAKTYPYTREKYGLLHIYMTFSYINSGTNSKKDRSKETYHFVSDISVVANLVPVLSRFSLYIEDALDGNTEDLDRFNVFDTNSNGVLNKLDCMPWILRNHDHEEGINTDLKSYKSIIDSSRGLVYLGGAESIFKAIKLGLTFGETDGRTPFGESLHFFYNDDVGYWKNQACPEDFRAYGDNVGLLSANLGLCNDKEEIESDDDDDDDDDDDYKYSTYFGYTGGSDDDKLSSIFKLYGTDLNPSPTIVLGYVDSKYASVKQVRFSDEEDKLCLMPNYDDDETRFLLASSYYYNDIEEVDEEDDCYDDSLTNFAFMYRLVHSPKKLELKDYSELFSSRIESNNYNRGYPSALNHTEEFPFKNNLIEGDDFVKLFKKRDNSIFTDVPYYYNEIYPDAKLSELSNFLDLDKLNINNIKNNNDRIAHYLTLTFDDDSDKKGINIFRPIDIEKDFIKFLKSKGIILANNKIDFNGWLFINNETDSDLVIDFKKMKLASHGGIILSNGNIRIKSNIISDTDDKKNILTLITLGTNKDIIIDEYVDRIDTSLICKDGQIKLEGKSKGIKNCLEINGNVIMKKIHSGEDGLKYMRRGLKLNYNTDLSAKPFKNTDEEKNVLMFNLNDNPKMINNE